MPLQTVSLSLVTATPHPPVAAKKIRQDTSLLVGKEGSQCWKSDCRAAYPVKELNHLLPLVDRSTAGRATAQLGLVLRRSPPSPQGPFWDMQAARHLAIAGAVVASLGRLCDAAAEILFCLSASRLALAGSPAARIAVRVGPTVCRRARVGPVRIDVRTRLRRGR
jgi:hypothetical protein